MYCISYRICWFPLSLYHSYISFLFVFGPRLDLNRQSPGERWFDNLAKKLWKEHFHCVCFCCFSLSFWVFHSLHFIVLVCLCVAVLPCMSVPDRQKAHLSSVNYRTIRVEFCNLFSVSVGCNKCSYLIVG